MGAKRGLGGSKSARMAQAVQQGGGIEHLSAAASQIGDGVAQSVTEDIDIRLIDIDPTNSRNLDFVDFKNPKNTVVDEANKEQVRRWERIVNMASNIKATRRLANPVEVYQKSDGRFQLVHGHRRYVATRLAEMTTIRAQITSSDSTQKKLMQWSENFHSEGLSLNERMDSFQQVYEEIRTNETTYAELLARGNEKLREMDIASILGMSPRYLRAYKQVLAAPDIVKRAIEEGVLRSLDKASELCGLDNPSAVKEAIRALTLDDMELYQTVVTHANKAPKQEENQKETPTPPEKPKGRAPKYITTKPIKSPVVVKHIFDKLGIEDKEVDWNDLRSVREAWQQLLDKLTEQLENGAS